MKKIKISAAIAAVLALTMGISSCGLLDEIEAQSGETSEESAAAESGENKEDKKDKNESSGENGGESGADESAPEPEEQKAYSWAVEPTVEADDIFCPNNTFHKADSLGGYENAVIMKDGKYAVIGIDGKLLSEDYADVFTMYESADEDFGLALFSRDYHEIYSINKNSGSGDVFEYVYDAAAGQIAVDVNGSFPDDLESGVLQEGKTAAVRLVSQTANMREQYCIYSNGAADTSQTYDNCAQPKGGMPEGGYVICVEKDGKWGYYNSEGKMILPCEYDANYYPSSPAYEYWQSAAGDEVPQFDEASPYLDSEGYIAVEKDGAAGYYDLNGNAVIELGEFEEARPVYGGEAWVKKDGKWGVIKMEQAAPEIEKTAVGAPEDDTSDSEASSSADSLESSSNNSQTLAYAKIIDECKEVCDSDPDNYGQFSRYYIVDIDDDGVMELITDLGSCEADRLANIYTYDGTQAVDLGSFVSWRSFFGEGDGVLYSEATAMGSYTLSTITISGGAIQVERGEASGQSRLVNPLTAYGFDDLSGLESIN